MKEISKHTHMHLSKLLGWDIRGSPSYIMSRNQQNKTSLAQCTAVLLSSLKTGWLLITREAGREVPNSV